VVAAGRANHAGKGSFNGWWGNADTIGIEAENNGLGTETWPHGQMEAYERLVAALLTRLGKPASSTISHYEWAGGRKPDPRGPWLNGGDWWSGGTSATRKMNTFRARVAARMEEDDMFTDADRALLVAVNTQLNAYFGLNPDGTAKDIRAKIDANYVGIYGDNHPDLLAGRVLAIEAMVADLVAKLA
jgi:hypothetical protein